ncbi:MAG TPA: membrane bound O-acyl transferase family-domain-containing protein [Thermoanaerobaculia bacterium]|nr:membrane bound O-acyl transferase family-domain-containing protein [Thermoanaerobaculia bacterium]
MNGGSAIVRMLVRIAVTFVAMKVLVVAVTRTRLTATQWLAFLGWFGMRPAVFTQRSAGFQPAAPPASCRPGVLAIAAGLALLLLARRIASPAAAFLLALPALSLILHFGIVDVATALYRRSGWPVNEPFRNPLASRSLSEFWSRRWNVGFSEMIAVTVHRPVRRVAGGTAALFASFLASGLLHELAISVPVRAGYGLPTLYFLLHGALVGLERRFPRVASRAWTIFWLVAPLPILFHPPFLRGIVGPLVGR